MRRRAQWIRRLSFVAVVATCSLCGAVGARATTTDPTQIVPGAVALGGSVTGPGLTTARSITASQAGTFMQSWLAYSVVGHPVIEKPSAGAATYRITIRQQFREQNSSLVVLYATAGGTAWVTMPPPQDLGWAFVTKPSWIRAQTLTITAFRDAVGVLPQAGSKAAAGHTGSSGSSSTWIWIVVAAVALIAIIGVALGVRRRSRR